MSQHHSRKKHTPIVWTIAGSDSGGGAGIQADLATFQDLGAHGCSIVTALTAQNSHTVTNIAPTSAENFTAQLAALHQDLPAPSIKIGMLPNTKILDLVSNYLKNYPGITIFDPVMIATSGADLSGEINPQDLIEKILPHVDLITPNLTETEKLLGQKIQTPTDIEKTAKQLHQLGAKAVLIKGGHHGGEYAQDFYYSSDQQGWLNTKRLPTKHTHGSGCTLSSAIAACCALGYSMTDSLVIAKAYVTQGIRLAQPYGKGPGPVAHAGWPIAYQDFPSLTPTPAIPEKPFPRCTARLGFYPIVDNSSWIERLLKAGVKTLQLRIKSKTTQTIETEIIKSIQLAKTYQAQLFINDHWELAIAHKAYGVHLGQEDLLTADIKAIQSAGLRLGISTHCHAEVARALSLQPSYIACGPIYPTTCKSMAFGPQGVEKLAYWQALLGSHYPLVAIGGISLERLPNILATGVDGVAVISAVTQAEDPERVVGVFLEGMIRESQGTSSPLEKGAAKCSEGGGFRYTRQTCLPQINQQGQKRLQQTRVLCIGAGGLGSPLLLYLAAAGIGTIGIVDDDTVSLHNLHRQILYQTQHCGQLKTRIAVQQLKALNPDIQIIPHNLRLNETNAHELIKDYDIIADGSDNFETRYLVNDACFAAQKILVSASVVQFSGQLTSFIPPAGPCYRCLFEEQTQSNKERLPNCNEAGVLGAAAGVLGALQATEVIKLALGLEDNLVGQLLRVDLENMDFQQFELTKDPECAVCQSPKANKQTTQAAIHPDPLSITLEELQSMQAEEIPFTLLDVRTPEEYERYHLGGLLIPLDELSERYIEIPTTHLVIVYCHSGQRSFIATQFLDSMGIKAKNLIGGIAAL